MSVFSKKDLQLLASKNISSAEGIRQLTLLETGVRPIDLHAPAIPGKGILTLTKEQEEKYIRLFEQALPATPMVRFVPASGAASRMFKAFYQYRDSGVENEEIRVFKENYQKLPFYEQIKCQPADFHCSLHKMLDESGLPQLPKALIPFHRYPSGSRTAFTEHLVESGKITAPHNTRLHFTVSPAHQTAFEEEAGQASRQLGGAFHISFSHQSPATDTLAIDLEGHVVRNEHGELLLRPGGHGSLLPNLNQLQEEIIFIKNIDNIQPEHRQPVVVYYKKVLGGLLLSIRKKVHNWLRQLEVGRADLQRLQQAYSEEWQLWLPDDFASWPTGEQETWFFEHLNRPIRVCGMVANQGEPGGGPYWVKEDGEISLQIVEASQFDKQNQQQAALIKQATHFNPVDIVGSIYSYRGQKFDLSRFANPATAFISEKSLGGKTIKVLEHPGLWNGGMAYWLTVFVEVPLATFAPVKTITDLLKPAHQPD